jgi:hypothetical protein
VKARDGCAAMPGSGSAIDAWELIVRKEPRVMNLGSTRLQPEPDAPEILKTARVERPEPSWPSSHTLSLERVPHRTGRRSDRDMRSVRRVESNTWHRAIRVDSNLFY